MNYIDLTVGRPPDGRLDLRAEGDTARRIDKEFVTYRLEEAGAALLSLPNTGFTTALRTSGLDVVRAAADGYGWSERQVRPPVPSAERISRMDEALAWMSLIPADRYVLRRIVGARSLVSPLTERHLYSWRRLAGLLGADHKAVQRWHGQGIDMIVAALGRGGPDPQSARRREVAEVAARRACAGVRGSV